MNRTNRTQELATELIDKEINRYVIRSKHGDISEEEFKGYIKGLETARLLVWSINLDSVE